MKSTLQETRDTLKAKLERREAAHSKRFAFTVSEDAYQKSVKELRSIHAELSGVCDKLGEPIPVWL